MTLPFWKCFENSSKFGNTGDPYFDNKVNIHKVTTLYILGKPSIEIFGNIWDFVPTRSTPPPPPSPKVGTPKTKKK